jgi:hypothetical protein
MQNSKNHYILTVKDSINNYQEIGQIYCDVNTTKQAKKFFLSHNWVKKYVGNKRYQITFKQNAHLLQDSE